MMGARNGAAALTVPKVSDRAVRVLVAMALHALDEPSHELPARHYHGGRDLLCASLGWYPDAASRHRITRALSELERHGLIARDGGHGPGHPQGWWLCLPGLPDMHPVD